MNIIIIELKQIWFNNQEAIKINIDEFIIYSKI